MTGNLKPGVVKLKIFGESFIQINKHVLPRFRPNSVDGRHISVIENKPVF